MRYGYRVVISYKGTHFHGWQAQAKDASSSQFLTVQGVIKTTLLRISRYQECSISATSRTDAGVHALGQLGKIRIPKNLEPEVLQRGLNSLLPDSVRILSCSRCADDFNPKTITCSKEYHYWFSMSDVANPVLADVVAPVRGPLNLAAMQTAAKAFVGEHDFKRYCPPSSLRGSSVRTIISCKVVPPRGGLSGDTAHCIEVVGTGFLKYMVRYMCGVLFEVSRGQVTLKQVLDSLQPSKTETSSSEKLARKASARGLTLFAIQTHD